MNKRSRGRTFLSFLLIGCMVGMSLAAGIEAETASLSGSVVWSGDRQPLSGAKLYIGDPTTGEIFASRPTGRSGDFSVDGLPPAAYQLAVEAGGGLYPIATPVMLQPGQRQTVNVAVVRARAAEPNLQKSGGGGGDAAAGSIWSNPMTAALLVIGSAVVLGFAVDELTDDTDSQTASASQ